LETKNLFPKQQPNRLIISGLKKNIQKFMKALIPVNPKKKIGHYNGCKMDYP